MEWLVAIPPILLVVLLAVSEILGILKVGPNGILDMAIKIVRAIVDALKPKP